MNTLPAVVTQSSKMRRRFIQLRSTRYFWLAICSYLLVILAVVIYINRPPVYASTMSVVLPGSGNSSSFNIEDVGQASQDTKTPFGSMAFSPLVNYKEIIRGQEVLLKASSQLKTAVANLRVPRVELRERSSILYIYLDASSPENASQYAWAVYQAFQETLEALRTDEILKRDAGIKAVLEQYHSRLTMTRQTIVDFQQRSLLIYKEQVAELMKSISALDDKYLTLVSSAKNTEDYVNQLSIDLGISPSFAGLAFKLQSDAEFRGYLSELDSSAAKLAEYSSRWGEKHQKVIAQSLRYENAKNSLLFRSQQLVGKNAADALHAMDLESSPKRAELFGNLVEQFAKLQGDKAEINEIEQAQIRMSDKLRILSREAVELERLEREHALAEAVYTSAAAKLEAGRADIYASYPAVQLLSVPNIPTAPKSPNIKIAVAMGFLGFLFITFGLVSLWHRRYFIDLLLKND